MAKMHELLAVEASVVGNFNRDLDETLKVLGKPELFTREVVSKKHFAADEAHLDTIQTKDITTTVNARLDWNSKSITDLFDLILQKDKTNQVAKADIEVDGKVLAKDVPATTLLMLESRLQDVRKIFDAAPTLQSGVEWKWNEKESLYETAEPTETFSTKKIIEPFILAPATDKHPAQVEKLSRDVPVAKLTKSTYSGMITSTDKAELLGRLDKLLQAIKKARMRANGVEASTDKFGAGLVNFLYDGVVKKATK